MLACSTCPKISATVLIAIPKLEFLSTLISLPKVFASFSTDQFLSVFASTLPYINPFKFNHYTVSLTHHVVPQVQTNPRKDFLEFKVRVLELMFRSSLKRPTS